MNEEDAAVLSYSEALFHAVDQGNRNLAKELLKAGANVNANVVRHDEDGERLLAPVMDAIFSDDLEMLNLLLEYNPKLNDENANGGYVPLVAATWSGNVETVRALLAHPGIIVNTRNSKDWFALKMAAFHGRYDIVNLLVNRGRHSKGDFSEALGEAACQGHLEIMRFLIEQGADANHYCENNRIIPPLVNALAYGDWRKNQARCGLDALRLLIRSGASFFDAFDYLNGDDGTGLWLLEQNQTISTFKRLAQEQGAAGSSSDVKNVKWALSYWDAVVATVWFLHSGLDHATLPPSIQETARLSDEEFKMAYKWMVHAVASLQFLHESNHLLDHLCKSFDSNVALEPSDRNGKTPLLLAIEARPPLPLRDRYGERNSWSAAMILIDWNPDALKIPHPENQRTPMTCAIVYRVPLFVLRKMTTCKKEKFFTTLPLQQDPVTLLPNFLLVASTVGEDSWQYSVSDIYEFSRDFLPVIIALTLKSPPGVLSRRGIKRCQDQMQP